MIYTESERGWQLDDSDVIDQCVVIVFFVDDCYCRGQRLLSCLYRRPVDASNSDHERHSSEIVLLIKHNSCGEFAYPKTQWPAVSTQLAEITDPPHSHCLSAIIYTCHGYCFGKAVVPPMICFDALKYETPADSVGDFLGH